MRILFFGDVVGRTGRDGLAKHLPELKRKSRADVVIVNAENAAAPGVGLTTQIAQELYAIGTDCITTGNHVWDQREIITSIDRDERMLRPLNYFEGTPGRGFYIHKLVDGRKILIANVMGSVFMHTVLDDPFRAMDKIISQYPLLGAVQAIFLDFHAEATSEKTAMGHYLDGRVSVVVGTHTHIPTSDTQILPGGTAYQTDAGMCGDYDSVIGAKKESLYSRFIRKMPGERKTPAEGEATLCGIFVVTDDKTGKAVSVSSFAVGGRLQQRMPEG